MKNESFDSLTKKALSAEEFQFMTKMEEQNIFDMLAGVYKGKMKWISIYIIVVTTIAFGFCIYFTIRFFQAEVKQMIMWGAGAFFTLLLTSLLKLWIWLQMNNNAILREIKRMELQISIIAENMK